MRSRNRGLGRSACLLALLWLLAAAPAFAGTILVADLDGLQEVPPNASAATGKAIIDIDDDDMGLSFQLDLFGIMSPILQGHIHVAPVGANGPIRIFLFELCPLAPNGCDGELNQIFGQHVRFEGRGVLSPSFTGSFEDVVADIKAGNAYINIHTEDFVGGEIRGQIVPEPGTAALFALGLASVAFGGRRIRR